jgi:hypothetical protein
MSVMVDSTAANLKMLLSSHTNLVMSSHKSSEIAVHNCRVGYLEVAYVTTIKAVILPSLESSSAKRGVWEYCSWLSKST